MRKTIKAVTVLTLFTLLFSVCGSMMYADATESSVGIFSGVKDIGKTGKPGSVTYKDGIYTIKSSGDNIWWNADGLTMGYTEMEGDMEICARVLSLEKTAQFAKVGVMVREKLIPESEHIYVGFKPTSGIEVVWRSFEKGQSRAEGDDLILFPYWIKLARYKNIFTASCSEDGKNWEKLTAVEIDMAQKVYIGIACVSNTTGSVTTAKLDNVIINRDVQVPTGLSESSGGIKYSTDVNYPDRKLSYKVSWLGNTFGNTKGRSWIQNNVEAMSVSADGYIYTNSGWDEGGRSASVYSGKDGSPLGRISQGGEPAKAVAVSGNSLYVAKSINIFSYKLTDPGNPKAGPVFKLDGGSAEGLACYNNQLYVSCSDGNIKVFDLKTRKRTKVTWKLDRAGAMVVDKAGTFWIIQRKTDGKKGNILHYSAEGKLLSESIADVDNPAAITLDASGRLVVAENGPGQQVLFYDITKAPRLVKAFGTEGGIYAGAKPGVVSPDRFNNLTGVGVDKEGNLYVSMNSPHSVIRKFAPSGKFLWQVVSLCFVDSFDFDPASDGKEIYGVNTHVKMDYSKTAPGSEWSWYSNTYNLWKYPEDSRFYPGEFQTNVNVQRLQGKLIKFVTGMHNSSVAIYRFDGEIAVPAGYISSAPGGWSQFRPENKRWIWRDLNGDGNCQKDEYEAAETMLPGFGGYCADSNGDIWVTHGRRGIGHIKFKGFDKKGNPIYSLKSGDYEINKGPEEFEEICSVKYIAETDSMYIAGYTKDNPRPAGDSGVIGKEIARYDNWTSGGKLSWRTVIPYVSEPSNTESAVGGNAVSPVAFEVEGDLAFVGYVNSGGPTFKGPNPPVAVYSTKNGGYLGSLNPGPEVGSNSGWLDISEAIHAFRRSNGDYVITVEEDAFAKNILYTIPAAEVKRALEEAESK